MISHTIAGADECNPGSGGSQVYVNLFAAATVLKPPGVFTLTLTDPTACGGEVMVIFLPEFTTRPVPAVVPNVTAVAPVNQVPVIVTIVPPRRVPLAGDTFVTLGPGT